MANGRKPDFIARSKENPDSSRWITIGAAWRFAEDKGEGYAVRINCQPVVWDGTFILVPPLEDDKRDK